VKDSDEYHNHVDDAKERVQAEIDSGSLSEIRQAAADLIYAIDALRKYEQS